MKKQRVILKLDINEAALVGPLERFQHLIELYETMAFNSVDKEDAIIWQDLADWVKVWMAKTVNEEEELV